MTEYQKEQFPIPTPGRLKRELRLPRPPWWMIVGLIGVIIATWIPLYLIYQKRHSFSTLPKIHYVQDMDNQPGFGPQAPTNLFADGRAARTQITGTLARGQLRLDDGYFRGFQTTGEGDLQIVEFLGFPESIAVDSQLIERGRQRYKIYCALCHDDNGTGNGTIHQHAVALQETKWVPPTNLLTQEIHDRLDGQIFQAISDGVRNMPSYKTQISVEDRWAVVAYLRELQKSQPVAVVEEQKEVKKEE